MPLYEYKCVKCAHRFEKIESVSASETKKCPKCGAKAPRMASAPAIQFKGSGWYVTDYAGKNSAPPSGEASGEATPAKPDDKKSEKPAEKSDKSEKSSESKPASTDKGEKSSSRKKK